MAKIAPFVDVSGVVDTLNKIEKTFSTCDAVFDRTLKDMSSRAPGQVASAVTSVYGIKKGDPISSRLSAITKISPSVLRTLLTITVR